VTTCEADLMRQAACGDQEAFRQLWEAHPLSPRAQCDGKARDRSTAAFPDGAQPDTPAQTLGRTIPHGTHRARLWDRRGDQRESLDARRVRRSKETERISK